MLRLSVRNTGGLKAASHPAGHGLRNARERLRLLFGGAASLSLRESNGMTEAAVEIPAAAPLRSANR
jgi:LytS/YehU family sensor histidine kinase